MQSDQFKRLSLFSIILVVVIILTGLSLFLTTDSFIEHSFDFQRGNRHIIKINLILHKGVGDAYYSLMADDKDAFLDAITTVESAAGYIKSLSDDIGELKPEVWEQIMGLVKRMENLYDHYLDSGDQIPAQEIAYISEVASHIFQTLSAADIHFYDRLSQGSVQIKKNTNWSFALMTFLGVILVTLAMLLHRTLTSKIEIASELSLAKEDLEVRVQSRTEDLAKANVRLSHEIDERKEIQEAIQSLVGSIVGSTGQQCFDNIVSGLASWLEVECVALGEIGNDQKVHALSMLVDGEQIKEFAYNLKGTPCEVASQQGYCIYRENLAKFFPDDPELIEMGAESYVGVPIINEKNATVGILYAMSKQALHEKASWEPVFQIMASKAASEISRLRSEEDRNNIRNQLAHSQKIEALGTLAGGIAHDFNNIIAAVLGYSELLKVRLDAGSKEAKANSEVLKAAQRAKELTKQILAFSSKTDMNMVPVQMHVLVHEAMRLLRQTIPSTIEITLDICKEKDTVLADPSQLHQIVMNLCTNAYYATRKIGGSIQVSLRHIDIEQNLSAKVTDLAAGTYVLFTVTDNGEGMAPEVQSKVFEPFFTTKAPGEGTGMGMSVVHGIVKSCNGAIDISSVPGKGTQVAVYLPYYSGEKQEQPQQIQSLPRGKERVLVVDDEPVLAEMTATMLEDLGYSVTFFTSSTEAFESFRAAAESYDMVITDQTMPRMSGVTLAQRLLKEKPEIPIIIYTGYSEAINDQLAEEVGVKMLLNKPVERESLARAVRDVLDCVAVG